MNLVDKFNAIFFNNRTITGQLNDPEGFWDQVDRAQLLLTRLRDRDTNWLQPSIYLRGMSKFSTDLPSRTREGELEAIARLYATWCAIADIVNVYSAFQIDEWWMYKLEAASRHITERIMPLLHLSDRIKLESELPNIYHHINTGTIYDFSNLRNYNDFLMVVTADN